MKGRDKILLLFTGMVLLMMTVAQPAKAVIWFQDGRITWNGFIRETVFVRTNIPGDETRLHKSKIDYARTALLTELLYKWIDEPDLAVNLFTSVKYWYELAPALDSDLKDAIPHRVYKDYVTPMDSDILTELYVDIVTGNWQFTAGKQIVVWGETSILRTADVINPLDLRLGTPGIDDWEYVKRGLWLLRASYQTELPGNLSFEVIIIPGDYKTMFIPQEGTMLGPGDTSFNQGHGFGIFHWVQEKNRRDAPGWSLRDNWELGLRIRGYTWDLDWTLMYFNTLTDMGIAYPDRLNALGAQYVKAGLRSQITGETINPGDWPQHTVFKRKRYQLVGGTAQTMIASLNNMIARLEWVYVIGDWYNKSPGGDAGGQYYDRTRRDSLNLALDMSQVFTLPYVTHNWFNDKKLSVSTTLNFGKIFNHDGDLIVSSSRQQRPGDSHAFSVSYSFQQFFWHYKGMVMLLGNFTGYKKYMTVPMLAYIPSDHWRYEVGWLNFGDRQHHASDRTDRVMLRVRYEW
jgi:hypothetical protein